MLSKLKKLLNKSFPTTGWWLHFINGVNDNGSNIKDISDGMITWFAWKLKILLVSKKFINELLLNISH